MCHTRHRGGLKNKYLERRDFWHPILWWRMVLFKKSIPGIMVIRNPNWSTKILWYETGYAKEKILSPLKRPVWGRLHCWFCHKLLTFCWFILWWFACNIPDSDASEYSTTDTSNSSVDKYYVAIKMK
jgi:hypothetical protein